MLTDLMPAGKKVTSPQRERGDHKPAALEPHGYEPRVRAQDYLHLEGRAISRAMAAAEAEASRRFVEQASP